MLLLPLPFFDVLLALASDDCFESVFEESSPEEESGESDESSFGVFESVDLLLGVDAVDFFVSVDCDDESESVLLLEVPEVSVVLVAVGEGVASDCCCVLCSPSLALCSSSSCVDCEFVASSSVFVSVVALLVSCFAFAALVCSVALSANNWHEGTAGCCSAWLSAEVRFLNCSSDMSDTCSL